MKNIGEGGGGKSLAPHHRMLHVASPSPIPSLVCHTSRHHGGVGRAGATRFGGQDRHDRDRKYLKMRGYFARRFWRVGFVAQSVLGGWWILPFSAQPRGETKR